MHGFSRKLTLWELVGATYPPRTKKMLHAERRSEPLVRTDVYLAREQRDFLKELGVSSDISMAEVIRRVLDKHIRRERRKAAANG